MSQNLFNVLVTSKSLVHVFVKQFVNDVLCYWTDTNSMFFRVWVLYCGLFDQLEHMVSHFVIERRNAHKHLIDENPERPPVNSMMVSCAINHLWSQIFGGSTEAQGNLTSIDHPAQPKIGQEEVAIIT